MNPFGERSSTHSTWPVILTMYNLPTYDAITLKIKVRYLDPAVICENAQASPKWMPDNDDYLKPFETKKKKQKKRKRFHEETFSKVVAYISLMMTRWEDMDVIYAPYHI